MLVVALVNLTIEMESKTQNLHFLFRCEFQNILPYNWSPNKMTVNGLLQIH